MEHTHADVTEIADGIYRISTFVPDVTPTGFTFNQFLLTADEPLLFHAGHRAMFPWIAEAVATVVPVESLRWLSFGHVEADECGAVNMWLKAAPASQVTFGALGCEISLNDMCDRPTRPLADGEVLDLGGKRVRQISTPHVPHGWEAQVLFEETTGTLLCGDLFTQPAGGPALTTDDVVALGARDRGHVPGDVAPPAHRRDPAVARRPPPDDAGDDARVVVPGRRWPGAPRPGGRPRSRSRSSCDTRGVTALPAVDPSVVEAFWQRLLAHGSVAPSTALPAAVEPFGDSVELADELIVLVTDGPKRATAGALADYEALGDPLPVVGDLWIATDGAGAPRALLRTSEVRIGPLSSVDDAFAWDEGEGDRTRRGWLDDHQRFFRRFLPTIGVEFTPDMPTVFKRFDVLYRE